MTNENSKKILSLYKYYLYRKKQTGKVDVRFVQFNNKTITKTFNLEEVKICKANDGNLYIRLRCSFIDEYGIETKSYRYFNDKNEQVSYAEFECNNTETFINYLNTKKEYRHKDLIKNAMLKIEDYSIRYNKGKPLILMCIKREDDKGNENRNLKFYSYLGFKNIYNVPPCSDGIVMKKDLNKGISR